jgi:hypothetical protein
MTTELTFRVEQYTDINSKNTCELFSVYVTEERDGISIKTKIWERDYGSQTESMDVYISDYMGRMQDKQTNNAGWVSTSTQ